MFFHAANSEQLLLYILPEKEMSHEILVLNTFMIAMKRLKTSQCTCLVLSEP